MEVREFGYIRVSSKDQNVERTVSTFKKNNPERGYSVHSIS